MMTSQLKLSSPLNLSIADQEIMLVLSQCLMVVKVDSTHLLTKTFWQHITMLTQWATSKEMEILQTKKEIQVMIKMLNHMLLVRVMPLLIVTGLKL